MKAGRTASFLVIAFAVAFGIELANHSVANDASLLQLGALPDNGQLNGQYWRVATYSFLHFNWAHLLINVALLLWLGRVVERRVGILQTGTIYFSSVLSSAALILLVHNFYPKPGATVGASGGIFGLLGAALVIAYRGGAASLAEQSRLRAWLWSALLAGFGVSLLPNISMAGHLGGLICGAPLGWIVKVRKNDR
jgi:rhomboid protease GluP